MKIKTLFLIFFSTLLFSCDKQYTIRVESSLIGCSVTGGGTYTSGTIIEIGAIPIEGYKFSSWNDGSSENPRTLTVTGNATYRAYFERSGSNGGGSGVSAPTGLSSSFVTVDGVEYLYVSWNNVTNAVKYNIYYCTVIYGSYQLLGSTNETYAYINTTNTDNYVRITALDRNGSESERSDYTYCRRNSGGGGGGGGTTIPNAPSNVTATNVGSSSSPQVLISWSSVSNATYYKVYRSSSANGGYSQIGSSTSNTSIYDNNPMSGLNYYKVKAGNNAGESPFSSYTSYNNNNGGGGNGTTTYSPCPPTVNVSGSSSQSVSWTISTSSGCGNPTSYEVYKYDPCSGSWELKSTTSSRSYSVPSSDIHPGINRYAVKAINDAGSATNYGYSSEVPLSKPATFSAQKQDNEHIRFTWSSVPKATGYQIFQSSSANGSYYIFDQVSSSSTTSLTSYFPGTPGTTYYFKIKAVYSCGTSPVYSDLSSYKSVRF